MFSVKGFGMVTGNNIPYLMVLHPDGEKRVALDGNGTLTIGRRPNNDLCLDSDRVSRYHCIVKGENSVFQIVDMGSHNGIGLNGNYVKKSQLKNGDLLSVGGVKIRFIDPKQEEEKKKAKIPRKSKRLGSGANGSGENGTDIKNAKQRQQAAHTSGLAELTIDEQVETNLSASDYYNQAVSQLQSIIDRLMPPFGLEQISLVDCTGVEVDASNENAQLSGRSLVRLLLLTSIPTRSTDIHIEPRPGNHGIRFRVDGVMVDVGSIHPSVSARMTSAIKVLCHVDISQKQVVQEGHFSLRTPNRQIDYRVSFTPTMHGQKMVMRIHDIANCPQNISQLRLAGWVNDRIRASVKRDTGMLMVCGPTGSGKTTTLYAIIRDLDVHQRNVITIEDPIEYQLDGITQIPVNESQGNSFSSLLRSVLRQDPDIILLGEVRDAETAKIALQAAVTGHQVLSTVHARDVISSVYRLIDLGIEAYLVASALDMVLAQRLVRQLCPHCKVKNTLNEADIAQLGTMGDSVTEIFTPSGCVQCLNTGFMGRRAMFEMLNMNEEIRDLILAKPSIQELRKAINETGFVSMRDFGCSLVAKGITSLDEVERVAGL